MIKLKAVLQFASDALPTDDHPLPWFALVDEKGQFVGELYGSANNPETWKVASKINAE